MLEGTRAALTIADWLIARYEQLKTGRGFLDFNDLITRTVRLLARQDAGAWVQYKLDQGIDHILLDEAQDTSPEQWGVVQAAGGGILRRRWARATMSAARFSPSATRSSRSIPSRALRRNPSPRRGIEFSRRRCARPNAGFEQVRLTLSFRSTNDVLHAVDRVFASDQARRGITHDPDPVRHDAIRFGAPGYVEVWPSIGADAVQEPDDWTLAMDHAQAPAVRRRGDRRRTIEHWLDSGEVIEGTGKRLTPGDVMVLVRKRDRFVHALSRSLKEKQDSGGRRGPAEPSGAYRGQGHDRARPLPAAAGGRSVAGGGAAQPGLRAERGHAVRARGQAARTRHSLAAVPAPPGAR